MTFPPPQVQSPCPAVRSSSQTSGGTCGPAVHRARRATLSNQGDAMKQNAHLRRPVPADFAEVYGTMPRHELAAHYKCSNRKITEWAQELGVKNAKRPVPADFAQRHAELTNKALRAHYQATSSTITRWIREAGVSKQNVFKLPPDIDELVAGHSYITLAEALGCGRDALRNRIMRDRPDLHAVIVATSRHLAAIAGAEARRKLIATRRIPISAPKIKVTRATDNASTQADLARAYLQRFGPCYSAKFSAQPQRGGYFFKGLHYTDQALIAEAKRRGWEPDAWRRLAA